MSIDQFGQSLLTDVRRRREQQSRRLRKQQERDALLGLGINIATKIGNEMLAQKTSTFLNNEQVWDAELAQKQARQNAAEILKIQTQIQAGDGDELSWAIENMGPEFETRVARNLDDEYTGDAGPYREWLAGKVETMARDWVDNQYKPALSLAEKIASEDDFESMVALNASRARPANVGSFITRSISNALGGKSREDVEQEAVLAITEGRMAKNAEALNVFMNKYETTGDLVRAFNVTEMTFPKEELTDDKKFRIDNRTQKLQEIDDRLVIYEQVEKTEINTGSKSTEITEVGDKKPRVLFEPDSDDDAISLDVMKGLNTIFNFEKDGRQLLRSGAYANFADEAIAANLNIQAPKTIEEHNQLQAIYRKYLKNSDNLQDQYRDQKTLRTFDLVVGKPEEIQALLSSSIAEDDPEKRNEMLKKLQVLIATKLSFAEQLQSDATFDYTTTLGN